MILFDTHMHSEFSTDSNTPLKEHIKKAEELKLKGICITDHMDYDFPQKAMETENIDVPFCFDIPSYLDYLQKESQDANIQVLYGVECGLQAMDEVIEKNQNLVTIKDFDYVIGSLHLVNKIDPYYPSYWEGKSAKQCVMEYFEILLENLHRFSSFDSLGHMDYIVRYAPADFQYEPEQFMDVMDEILKWLIHKDIALEINTSGWKTKNRCQNPHLTVLKHYASLGGELLTIGSDSHTPEYISYRFSELSDLLKKTGFRQYCVYQKRNPVFYDL